MGEHLTWGAMPALTWETGIPSSIKQELICDSIFSIGPKQNMF